MKLKRFLEEMLESGSSKRKSLAKKVVGKLLFVCLVIIMFFILSNGLRRIDKDYDKRWVKCDVRFDRFFNKE